MSSPPPHATSTLPSTPTSSHPPPYTLTHLDHLLTTYLTYLDTYTTHRTLLSTSLSTGFLQLAQAQRSSMLPPGQRYGQEMYDQRMKAGRRVRTVESRGDGEHTAEEDEGWRFELDVYTYPEADGNSTSASKSTSMSTSTSTAQTKTETSCASPSSPSPTKPKDASRESQTRTKQEPTPSTTATSAPPPNPLSQFATLPPPPLRSSQTSFRTALASIPTLLNTSRAMWALEAEIEHVRRALGLDWESKIGIETDTEGTVVDDVETEIGTENETAKEETEMEKGAVDEGEDDGKTATATSPASPKRRSLASRSKMTEPRSRVLKLGA